MNLFNSGILAASRNKLRRPSVESASIKNLESTICGRRQFDVGSGEQKDIDEYQKYVLLFNFEHWNRQLVEETFPTQILELSVEDGCALKDCYDRIMDRNEQIDAAKTFKCYDQLEACMTTFSHGCFVKTSCRSAKDYADLDKLRSLFTQTMSSLCDVQNVQITTPLLHLENIKMIAMSYSSMELLKMRSAKQVFQNFIRSERIWHDMHLALAHSSNWNEALVVREWINIEPDMEFRCFVCEGILTAISQYRHLVYFPRLYANQEYLKHEIQQFLESTAMEKLKGLFPQDDYIIDLAVELQHRENIHKCLEKDSLEGNVKKIWVVEINPFYETTDACMFSWSHDSSVLMNIERKDNNVDKTHDVEMRIRDSPARGSSSLIYGAWKDVMNETLITV